MISASQAALWLRVSRLDWLTAAESAVYMRLSKTVFESCVRLGPIHFSRPAGPRGDRRFRRANLDRYLDSRPESFVRPNVAA